MAQNRDQETQRQGSGRHREWPISQGQAPHTALAFSHSALPGGSPSPPTPVPNSGTRPPSAVGSAKRKRTSPFSRSSEQSRGRGGRARPAVQRGAAGTGPSCQVGRGHPARLQAVATLLLLQGPCLPSRSEGDDLPASAVQTAAGGRQAQP